jgi:GT2 family glycosyltransferase
VKLCIVIPVYGNQADTHDCLRMLAAQSSLDFEVIVADDGSVEPIPDWVVDFHFVIWRCGPHRGFASNCNGGAREALSRGATHVLFLNNDTSFGTEFVASCLRQIARLPAAILSPLIYSFAEPSSVWYSGGRRGVSVPFFRMTREFRGITEVDIVCGCAMLVPASAWRALEGFDERFRMYYEDFDLCLRAGKLGFRLYVTPDTALVVRHKISRSFTRRWNKHYRMITYRYVFIRRHYRGWAKYACLLLTVPQLAVTISQNLPELPGWGTLWAAIREGLSLPAE